MPGDGVVDVKKLTGSESGLAERKAAAERADSPPRSQLLPRHCSAGHAPDLRPPAYLGTHPIGLSSKRLLLFKLSSFSSIPLFPFKFLFPTDSTPLYWTFKKSNCTNRH